MSKLSIADSFRALSKSFVDSFCKVVSTRQLEYQLWTFNQDLGFRHGYLLFSLMRDE